MTARAWLVRGGRHGETAEFGLAHGVVVVSWNPVSDLSGAMTREDIAQIVKSSYPDVAPASISNWVGQLYRFRHEMTEGDLVVMPLRGRGAVAIGRLTGRYEYHVEFPEGHRQTRTIDWLRTDVPRTAIGQDLLYSLGSLMTVCEITRNDAARRIASLAAHGTDPGAAVSSVTAAIEEAEVVSIDLERMAYDKINARLAERFSGHDMARLIEAIFQARGMTTFRSPEGADGGIDVLAGAGPLGMDSPRICIQVKFTSSPADVGVVRELEGVMNRVRAEQGLLVTWSGLTRAAEREVRQQFFRVRVWTADDVLRELTSVYDKLPEEIQIELPLKRVWMLTEEESEQ